MTYSKFRLAWLLLALVTTAPACLIDEGAPLAVNTETGEPVQLADPRGVILSPSQAWQMPMLGTARWHAGGFDVMPVSSSGLPVADLVAQGGQMLSGDFNGDGFEDFALVGGAGWSTVPVYFSNTGGWGSYTGTNQKVAAIPALATTPRMQAVVGDFNGDRRSDIALVHCSWDRIQLALSRGDGNFDVVRPGTGASFQRRLCANDAKARAGDFDGDGLADIVLVGGYTWTTLPIRFTRAGGNGYVLTDVAAPQLSQRAAELCCYGLDSSLNVLPGDFNGDGKTDLALTSNRKSYWGATFPRWTRLPVATSIGNGAFTYTEQPYDSFMGWLTEGARGVVGDFDRDGRDDIALVGGAGWWTVPVAYGTNQPGTFRMANDEAADFARFAAMTGARPVTRYSLHDYIHGR